MIFKVLRYCKSETLRICLLISLKAGSAILTIVLPLVFSSLIDSVSIHDRSMTYQILAFYAGLQILHIFFTYLIRAVEVMVSKNINFHVKCQITHYLFNIPIYDQKLGQGKMHSLVVSDSKAIYSFLSVIISSLFTILTVIGVGIVTIITDWRLTLVLITPYPFIAIINHFFRERIKDKTQNVLNQLDIFISVLKKTLGHIPEIQTQCGIKKITDTIDKEADIGRRKALEQGKAQNQFNLLISSIGFIGNMLFTFLGITLLLAKEITLGKFVAFSSYSKSLSSSLDGLINLKTNIQPILVSLDRVLSLENSYTEAMNAELEKSELHEYIHSIELKNINMSYGNNVVFQNTSALFQKGEVIGITGANGTGKTTLSHLIARMVNPNFGEIFINGKLCNSYNYFSYIQHVGYIGANKHLYPISVKNNILFSDKCVNSDFHDLCQVLGIEEYVNKLSDKYDTVVDDSFALSTGQIQKIQIARTLLKQCEVIIMDESMSNLDEQTKTAVCQKLKNISKDKIILIISHTANDYDLCDKVYRIVNNGLEQIR